MKQAQLKSIREIVSMIQIHRPDTEAGQKQRQEFKKRWGVFPEQI